MATRKRNHAIGDIGEAMAVRQLLLTGASINSLTASDYGWDLHLQLPEERIVDVYSKDFESWELSPYGIYVQVKTTTGDRVKARHDSIATWLRGTKYGRPTFLVAVKEENEENGSPGIHAFLTPLGLEALSRNSNAKDEPSLDLNSDLMLPYGPRLLTNALYTWSRIPRVMLDAGENMEKSKGARDEVFSILEMLLLGYLIRVDATADVNYSGELRTAAHLIAETALGQASSSLVLNSEADYDANTLAEALMQAVVSQNVRLSDARFVAVNSMIPTYLYEDLDDSLASSLRTITEIIIGYAVSLRFAEEMVKRGKRNEG